MTVLLVPRQRWQLLCKTKERLLNKQYKQEKINTILSNYKNKIKCEIEHINKWSQDPQCGRLRVSSDRVAKNHQTTRTLALKAHRKKQIEDEIKTNPSSYESIVNVFSLPDELKIPEQKYAAIIIINDNTMKCIEDREDIYLFLCTFKSEKKCMKWIKEYAVNYIKNYTIECVKMYEWIFPSIIIEKRNKIKEIYRESELNNIIEHHKSNCNNIFFKNNK
jgi:hypothetical protein